MRWLMLGLLGCGVEEKAEDTGPPDCATGFRDADGDGYGGEHGEWCDGEAVVLTDGDCDDSEPTVWPGAEEVCGDSLDNDCNGQSDCAEGCEQSGCPEVCADGLDNDDDGLTDCADDDCIDLPS